MSQYPLEFGFWYIDWLTAENPFDAFDAWESEVRRQYPEFEDETAETLVALYYETREERKGLLTRLARLSVWLATPWRAIASRLESHRPLVRWAIIFEKLP